MPLTPLRIDYVPNGSRCQACSRSLSEARIVRDLHGNELLYGPECIKSVLSPAKQALLKTLPNLTGRGTGASVPGGQQTGGTQQGHTTSIEKQAAEYLWLRLNKIAGLCSAKAAALQWLPLVTIFNNLRANGVLTHAEAMQVMAIENKAPKDFKRIRLLDVYSAAVQLNRLIARHPNNAFYPSLLGQLTQHLSLSTAQIASAGLHLPTNAFQ